MGGRLLLGIGSQCDGLPRLSFLPGVAEEVSEVLLDPRIGDCAPATADGRALLVDPTFVELDDAVTTAFQRASEEEATLFVSVIGHGEYNTDDFYLMAKDSSYPPSSRNAFHLAQRMKELLTHYSMLDGLVLLLDTCHAGIGAEQAARRWVKIVGQAGRRFEVLTASDERTAADGCFSRTLARVLRSGVDRFGERLRCPDLKISIGARCPRQQALYLAFDGTTTTATGDEGLWLGRNIGGAWRDSPLAGTPAAMIAQAEVERVASGGPPNPLLRKLVAAALGDTRHVGFVDPSAESASRTLATLAHPNAAPEDVPARFLHGVVPDTRSATSGSIAAELAAQLARTVPGFGPVPAPSSAEDRALDPFEYFLLRPLRGMASAPRQLRIGIGIGDCPPASLTNAVHVIATDPALSWVQLILAAEDATDLPACVVQIPSVVEHGTRTAVAADEAPPLSWRTRGQPPQVEQPSDVLTPPDDTAVLLALLDAVGTGARVPAAILHAAARNVGGPRHLGELHDMLARLRHLVLRSQPGTGRELVALREPVRRDWSSMRRMPSERAHRALADAIAEVVPVSDRNTPEGAYAENAEAEHLWQAGRREEALHSAERRASPVPAENRERWLAWRRRTRIELGPHHRLSLLAAARHATWTGKAGDPAMALTLLRPLLDECQRERDEDDRETLSVRHNLAHWLAEAGEAEESLRMAEELVADSTRILGQEHEDTLDARIQVVVSTGKTGDFRTAYELAEKLAPDCERSLGAEHRTTLIALSNLAFYMAETGHPPLPC